MMSQPVVDANARYFRADWDIIPNGVDTSLFRSNGERRRPMDALTDHPRLLFLGRIEPRNGLGTLLDSMPRILARFPGAVLTVVGDGPWRRYYERRARELGASVRFVGQVLGDRPAYYASADLYLCPTTIASFGVTLLEAMACGTPMIVSDNLGFRWVIDGGEEAVGRGGSRGAVTMASAASSALCAAKLIPSAVTGSANPAASPTRSIRSRASGPARGRTGITKPWRSSDCGASPITRRYSSSWPCRLIAPRCVVSTPTERCAVLGNTQAYP